MAILNSLGGIEQPGSQASAGIDDNINAQEPDEDELLNDVQLAEVAVKGQRRPWLRTNSLNIALGYRGPQWLVGYENWVYLLLLAAVAGGWWYFKKK